MFVRRDSDQIRPHSLSFRRLLLRNLAFRIFKHPYLALFLVIFLSFAAFWGAWHLEVDANLSAFVPRAPDEQRAWDAIALVNDGQAPVFAQVDLAPPFTGAQVDSAKVAAILEQAWADPEYIASIERIDPVGDSEIGSSRSDEDFIGLLQSGDLALLRQISSPSSASVTLEHVLANSDNGKTLSDLDPSDPFKFFEKLSQRGTLWRQAPDAPAFLLHQEPTDNARARLLFRLKPVKQYSELAYSVNLYRFLTETTDALQRRYPRDLGQSSINYYGRHMEAANLAMFLKDDLLRSAVILALCLILLMILAFRKIESILFIGLPSFIGLVWTLGMVSLFADSITLLTIVFIVLLMVPGLEYAVQIYHRFMEELYRERDYYQALSIAYTEAGRGVVVCSLVTFLISLSLYLSSFKNLRELGAAGALGIFSITAAILIILPLMAALKSRLGRGKVQPLALYEFGLKRFSATVTTSPRTALALLLIVTAYLAHQSANTTINRDIGLDLAAIPEKSSVFPVNAGTGTATGQPLRILIEGNSLQNALRVNDILYKNLLEAPLSFSPEEIDSVSAILPSDVLQSVALQEFLGLRMQDIRKSVETSMRLRKASRQRFEPFVKRLELFQMTARRQPVAKLLSDVAPPEISWIQKRLLRDKNVTYVLTTVYPRSQATENAVRRFPLLAAQAGNGIENFILRFDSDFLRNKRLSDAVLYSMAIAVLLAIVSLLVCLLPHFRWRFEGVLLAVLPLACAMVWTLGLLALLRFRIGLYTLLIFPLLVGISLNQSVLLIQRLLERRYASLRQVLHLGGRANVISALALLITFGCLGQTGYDPLQETALVAGAAIAFSTAITLVVIPAVLQIRQEGGLAAWFSAEDD